MTDYLLFVPMLAGFCEALFRPQPRCLPHAGRQYVIIKMVDIAKQLKPSVRGELEITTVNGTYLVQGDLKLHRLSRGFTWLDTFTHNAMNDATEFAKVVELRTGLKIS